MFGDLPEARKRKFILVDDTHRATRVRVRVTLDTVKPSEMPDSYRKQNSVFPRSYFPLQMTSPPPSPRGRGMFNDDESAPEDDPTCPVAGSSLVPVETLDGTVEVPQPRLTRAKRTKEITLNELAHRMSWSQSRVFAGRPLFLQKSCKLLSRLVHGRTTDMAFSSGRMAQQNVDQHHRKRPGRPDCPAAFRDSSWQTPVD